MKGLYLNVPGAADRAREFAGAIGAPGTVVEATGPRGERIVVSHHPADWPEGPIFDAPEEGLFAAASGWMLSGGRFGDLAGFARKAATLLRAGAPGDLQDLVDAGAFTVYLSVDGSPAWITDPFGLHPHYVDHAAPFATAAPAPVLVAGDREPDPVLAACLRRQNHLFGNRTAWRRIRRLPPGSCSTPGGTTRWFTYHGESAPEETVARLRDSLRGFADRPGVLPLSGGLDSRLLLVGGDPDLGYTFGPADSGDRPAARRFRKRFGRYLEFSLLDLDYPKTLRKAASWMFEGICPRPFLELLIVNRHVKGHAPPGAVCFDGYLGDVLKRGTYLTRGGVRGALAKLVPALTLRGFDARRHLRRRYAGLPEEGWRELEAIYSAFEEECPVAPPARAMLFEILHGRGARYTLNGGTLIAGQYFTVVQPYFIPAVFRSLFPQDPASLLEYRALRRVWRHSPRDLREVPTYSGFRPDGSPTRSRLTMLVTKGLARAGLHTRSVSYERELPLITWR